MAQNNIKVTFNSLYTPDSYKTYVSDNYVPGKVYMLSDKNNNINQSGKFTDVGIIKKDGVNYSGIVGIANGSNNIVGTGKSNGYIVHLDEFKLWFWLDEYNLLHIDTEGTLPNEWIGENPDAILNYVIKDQEQVMYNITSKYGVPKIHIIGTNDEYIELEDTGNSQETIRFDNEGSDIELKYIKNTIENSHECQLTFIFPENLEGFDVEKKFKYSVQSGKTEDGLDYTSLEESSTIFLKLIRPDFNIDIPGTTIDAGQNAQIVLRTKASEYPDNMSFNLTNAEIDTSNGYVELAENHNSQFVIKKFEKNTFAGEYQAIIDFKPGNNTTCTLSALFGDTDNLLKNTNNYNWSVIKVQSKTFAVKPMENISIQNYTGTGIKITSSIVKHPNDTLPSGTTVGTVELSTGYMLTSDKCTLGGVECTINDNEVTLNSVFEFGTENPVFDGVNTKQIEMTIKGQAVTGNNSVANIEGNGKITYDATATKDIKFTPNDDFNVNDATITVTVNGIALTLKDDYTTTTPGNKLIVKIKRSICANSANNGQEIIVTVAFAEIEALGYYSFNASDFSNIENLQNTDFTKKLTNNIVTSDDGIQIDKPCLLAFALPIDKTNAPVIQIYNSTVNRYGANMTLVQCTEIPPITINNANYNIWIVTGITGKSNPKFKFISF